MRGKVYQFSSNYFNFQYTKQKSILHNEKIKQQCARAQSKLESEQKELRAVYTECNQNKDQVCEINEEMSNHGNKNILSNQ